MSNNIIIIINMDVLKILVVGEPKTGKSQLIQNILSNGSPIEIQRSVNKSESIINNNQGQRVD